jgi:hypothetical protein
LRRARINHLARTRTMAGVCADDEANVIDGLVTFDLDMACDS